MKRFVFCGMTVLTVLIGLSAWADSVYRCPDGTFTNKAERQCPPYEPKGIVRIQTRAIERPHESMKGDANTTPSAAVKLFKDSVK